MSLQRLLVYDVIVAGGGPAGLSAALVLGRSCRKVLVIDAGQPRNAAAQHLNGFLGRDGTNPRKLLEDGRRELLQYDVEVVNDQVISAKIIQPLEHESFHTRFAIATEGGAKLTARKLLFATGVRDEVPELPGLRACYGTTAHHCPYCDGWGHRGGRLAAYGKRAEAGAGLAIALRGWSAHVTVLTNAQLLDDDARRRLTQNGIAIRDERIVQVVHQEGRMKGVELQDAGVLAIDAFFFSTGQQPSSDLPRSLGCEMASEAVARTSRKQQSAVPGIFMAGDAAGEVQFVIVAAAEGATAAVAINRELQEEDRASTA